jgi:DegV family protein with EDD domain
MCRVPPGHMPVAVVTDTTHYLPASFVAEYGLELVSLYVRWGDELERESEMPDFDGFYERLRTAKELPTTSQPSIGDFLAVYEPLVAAGHEIVSIHLSAGISGTYDGALQAKAQLEEQGHRGRIEVVDSATAAGGMGLVAAAAGAKARSGASIDEVVAHAEAAREQLKIWFAVDTLEYLRRGGRVGAAQAWLGGALKIKPILSLESEITPVERVRTSGKAFERMVDYMRSRADDGADAWVVQHIRAPDVAERLIERGREIYGTDPFFVSEVGPVIGAHVGPGLVGVGGIPLSFVR